MDTTQDLNEFINCIQISKLKKSAFENSLFPFYCKNRKGKYINSSNHLAHYAGFNKTEEIWGASDNDLFWNAYALSLMKNDKEAILSRKSLMRLETVAILQNAKQFVCKILSYKKPLCNRYGKVIGVQGISTLLHTFPMTSNCYGLSKRQKECLLYLIRGKSDKEIAKLLKLSHRTIESYVDEIKNKMNCNKRSMIIDKVFFDGLLNIDIENSNF